jgi:hypothetical protein
VLTRTAFSSRLIVLHSSRSPCFNRVIVSDSSLSPYSTHFAGHSSHIFRFCWLSREFREAPWWFQLVDVGLS